MSTTNLQGEALDKAAGAASGGCPLGDDQPRRQSRWHEAKVRRLVMKYVKEFGKISGPIKSLLDRARFRRARMRHYVAKRNPGLGWSDKWELDDKIDAARQDASDAYSLAWSLIHIGKLQISLLERRVQRIDVDEFRRRLETVVAA